MKFCSINKFCISSMALRAYYKLLQLMPASIATEGYTVSLIGITV